MSSSSSCSFAISISYLRCRQRKYEMEIAKLQLELEDIEGDLDDCVVKEAEEFELLRRMELLHRLLRLRGSGVALRCLGFGRAVLGFGVRV